MVPGLILGNGNTKIPKTLFLPLWNSQFSVGQNHVNKIIAHSTTNHSPVLQMSRPYNMSGKVTKCDGNTVVTTCLGSQERSLIK